MNGSDPPAGTLLEGFGFIIVTPPGLGDPALAIAASRAGSLGWWTCSSSAT
jgi:hypothetical protein